MSSFDYVYLEDGNILIGEDLMTERLRRELRQLHCSKFRRTRQEAHFIRYRNSFLKCELDRTNNRIDLQRRMKSEERERAMGTLLKQLEYRGKMNLDQTGETAMKLPPIMNVKQIQTSMKRGGNGSGLPGSRKLAGNQESAKVMKSSRVSPSLLMFNGRYPRSFQNIDIKDKLFKNVSVAVSISASEQSATSKRKFIGLNDHGPLLNRNKKGVEKRSEI